MRLKIAPGLFLTGHDQQQRWGLAGSVVSHFSPMKRFFGT
jgi:hypothetical protein